MNLRHRSETIPTIDYIPIEVRSGEIPKAWQP